MKMIFASFAICLSVCFSFETIAADALQGVMMVVKGDIKILHSADKSTEVAKVGSKVQAGDTIVAGADSRAKVVMADKNVFNISPDTKIVIEKYTNSPTDKNVEIKVEFGKVRSSVEQKYDGENTKFNVKTPSAVAGVRGTDFLTSYSASTKESQVMTFKGTVAVGLPGPNGSIQNPVYVKPGQMTRSVNGASPETPKAVPAAELDKAKAESTTEGGKGGANSSSSSDSKAKSGGNANSNSNSSNNSSSGNSNSGSSSSGNSGNSSSSSSSGSSGNSSSASSGGNSSGSPGTSNASSGPNSANAGGPAGGGNTAGGPSGGASANAGGPPPSAPAAAPDASTSASAPAPDSSSGRAPASAAAAPAASAPPAAAPPPPASMISTGDLGTGPLTTAGAPPPPAAPGGGPPIIAPLPNLPPVAAPYIPVIPPSLQKSTTTVIISK